MKLFKIGILVVALLLALVAPSVQARLFGGGRHRKLQATKLNIVNMASSSFRDPNYSGFAVDGNMETRWESNINSDDEWIWVQLPVISTLTELKLEWETAHASGYFVEVSNSSDSTDWTLVVDESNGNGGTETIDMGNIKAMYVRIRGYERGTTWGYSLWEIELYGLGAGADLPVAYLPPSSATASSFASISQTAAKAIDNDLGTSWSSVTNLDEYIMVALSNPYPVSIIELYWDDNDYAEEYTIEASRDLTYWTQVIIENSGSGGDETLTLPPAVTAQYLRLNCTSSAGSAYALREFKVKGNSLLPLPDAPTLAIVDAVASSVEAGTTHVAANAFDKNLNTRWSAQKSDTEYITFELASSSPINGIDIRWGSAYGKDYDIQTSVLGTTFTTQVQVRNRVGGTDKIDLPSSPLGKFVRIQGVTLGTKWAYSIIEVEVRGFQADLIPPNPNTPNPTPNPTSPGPTSAPSSSPTDVPEEQLTPEDVVASSVDDVDGGINTADLAIDGDPTTRWASARGSDSEFITLELQSTRKVTKVTINWEDAYASRYMIQTSLNNETYTTVATNDLGTGGIETVEFVPATLAKYVRMQGVERASNYGYSMYEFEVWGQVETT